MSDRLGGLLEPRAVRLSERAAGRFEAVSRCGEVLVDLGAVAPGYVEAMVEREHDISTYVGAGVAIPHATAAGKAHVRRDALAVLRFTEPIDWDGAEVTVCVAIAALGDGHLDLLADLAEILLDDERAALLRAAAEPADVLRLLGGGAE
ncbi:MAG TPA: PTS sugar transporter subunit IIA [Actinospica sp.]|nr:PTS sugar transporter subunit IIA [Actinospica sp.]